MILTSLQLKKFRKHKESLFNFSDGLNYIVGGNGQGKTSVLEAIYYLCTTKNCSTKSDMEVVNFNETEFEINGSFKGITTDKTRMFYSSFENKKYYYLNDKHVSRPSEVIGKFPVVILTPSDHSITQGSPGERRKFVDSVISQASSTYLNILLDYNKTLRHRSTLLSFIKDNRYRNGIDELDAWTSKLISSGTEIIKHRLNFINDFNSYIKESYKVIMEDEEIPSVTYRSSEIDFNHDIEKQFKKFLEDRRDEELRRASNLVGPHRDDFIFEINGLNLKTFGSQGQHKTFQIVLRFAEFFFLKEITGNTPVFLLDDVFGELDTRRSYRISSYLREVGQAFVTLTDFTNLSFLKKSEKDLIINLNEGEAVYA